MRLVVSQTSNNAQATAALKHYYGDLADAGVELWELPGTVVHAKVVVADDVVSFGTVNLDAWALYRNNEITMLAQSAETAELIEERLFEPDIARSQRGVPPEGGGSGSRAGSGARCRRSCDVAGPESRVMRKWLPLVILASAQFIMVLDSSVMNVSISQIVADLNTTVTGVQSAITMYTLVMAAFMLVGAKLGDILGRDRAFGLGLAVYGLGSLITSLSPNLTVLLIGWSGIEGLGAVLVIPAIAALTAANYQGKDRAFAYGMIGGAAGAAIAAGPLIGGYVTTTWSWRYVFVGEVVVVIAVLIVHRRMKRAPKPEQAPKLDYGGAALSAVALGMIVFGILKSSTWGWIKPIDAPTIDGHEITPLGILPGAVSDPGRLRRSRLLPCLGGAPRAARPEHASQSCAAEDRDAARRADVAFRAAADRDGHVLRPAGVSPGRARLRRV